MDLTIRLLSLVTKMKHLSFLLAAILYATTFIAQCDYVEVNAVSSTGEWGDEMGWALYGPEPNSMNLIASYEGQTNWNTSSDSLCLEPGCYAVVMTDSWGDGWNYGTLTFELPEEDVEVVMNDGGLAYFTFEIENGELDNCWWELPGCTDTEAENYIVGATYDDGSCMYLDDFTTSADDQREYYLYTPEDLPEGAPLVFVLHGYYGSGLSISSYCGMNEVADAEGFAVCYPHGLMDVVGITHWNANFVNYSTVDDLGFLSELALYLQDAHGFSAECTYSCGYSNGGYMSYSLACEHPDIFKAIGSVGGTMSNQDYENCSPSNVPVVHLHGTQDEEVSYEATEPQPGSPWFGQGGVEEIVAMWADANNCTETTTTSLPDLDPWDMSTVDLIEHTGGDNGYKASLYRVNAGGHDWFGVWGNMDIHSSVEMWSFFTQFCSSTAEVEVPEQPELVRFSSDLATLTGLSDATIQVFDQSGRMVINNLLRTGNELSLSELSTGVYTVIARGKEGVQSLRVFAP